MNFEELYIFATNTYCMHINTCMYSTETINLFCVCTNLDELDECWHSHEVCVSQVRSLKLLKQEESKTIVCFVLFDIGFSVLILNVSK